MIGRGGFGALFSTSEPSLLHPSYYTWTYDPATGKTIDCQDITNFFNSACWGGGTNVSTIAPGTTVGGTTVGPQTPSGPDINVTPSPGDPVDCTNLWNAITNSQCSLGSTFYVPILLGGALLLLVLIKR